MAVLRCVYERVTVAGHPPQLEVSSTVLLRTIEDAGHPEAVYVAKLFSTSLKARVVVPAEYDMVARLGNKHEGALESVQVQLALFDTVQVVLKLLQLEHVELETPARVKE